MAHVMKIKQGAVAPLVAHYERRAEIERGYRRANIDPERTALNYSLRHADVGQEVGLAIAQHEQTAGKGIRKDANVLFDWVVTLPKDCPAEKAGEFFEACVGFIERRYGAGNVLGAYVHMDETTPHVHVPVLPMKDGKLNMSKVVTRQDLRTFHGELGEAVDEALGFHVSVELDEQQKAEKALSAVPHEMLAVASAGLDAQIADKQRRLECLQREIEQAELQPASESVSESLRSLSEGRKARSREEGLTAEVKSLRDRISAAEAEKGDLEREVRELERREGVLGRGIGRARARLLDVEDEARELTALVVERFGAVPALVSDWVVDVAERLGGWVEGLSRPEGVQSSAERMSLVAAAAEAVSSSRAWERDRPRTPSRGTGRSR